MSPLPILLFLSILFASSSEGFLFGSAGGGGCSCPQPVCQPSFPACPSPISGPIGGGGQPVIVNCGGKDGGGYGCGGGRIHGGGGMREEKVINVVLVPEQQKGPYHGADGRSGCVGGPANKGEDGRGCDAGQQAIQVVLDGEHGGEHHPAPAPQPPRRPIGECPESGGPCDFVIEHGKEESYAAQPQQQYASASGGGGYASPQQPSNGAPQQQGQNAAGYAQQGNGGYAPQAPPSGGYAPQAPPSEGYSPQQQQQAQSEYNANQPPVQQPVESDQRQPVSASEQGFPSPALSNVPAVQSYQPPTSEVQPAASESEAGYGPSGNAAAAAAGDRLQEVQDAAESGGTQETDNGATISSPSSTAPSTTTVTPIVANLRTDTNNQQQQVAVKQQQKKKMSDEQHDVFIEPVDVNLLKLTNDTECNSEELRAIIRENLSYELNTAKRQIQLQAEARFGGRFDVICSHHDFSYITNTELWCQETRESTSCYAYRQLGY